MVKFVDDYIDEGAPIFHVSGPAAVERISDGQVMVTYLWNRDGQNVVVLRTVWDYETYKAVHALYARAYAELERPKEITRCAAPKAGEARKGAH